jgi:hypothetical protein
MTARKLINRLYSKYEATIDFINLCEGKNTGQKISMLFNPHRYDTATKNSISIVEAFNNHDTFREGLARATLFKKDKYTTPELLYQVFQLGVNGVQYVNEFPPFIARNHYKSFYAKKILDPCAGWGGRMIGAASVGAEYVGCEPCTKTYKGLLVLGEWLEQFETGFTYRVINKPFEDISLKELGVGFDIAYTSTPYYDTELYSDEDTNSCVRYDTFERWLACFYIPMINRALTITEQGIILNVGCRRYDLIAPLDDFNYKEIPTRLSGKSGLGRTSKGKESFYLVTK